MEGDERIKSPDDHNGHGDLVERNAELRLHFRALHTSNEGVQFQSVFLVFFFGGDKPARVSGRWEECDGARELVVLLVGRVVARVRGGRRVEVREGGGAVRNGSF